MRVLLICTLAVTLGMVGLALAQRGEGLTPKQKKEVEKLIADYLMKNPETLSDALDNMQSHLELAEEQRVLSLLKKSRAEIYHNQADFTLGAKTAPITIVEFFDYNCGYCKRAFTPLMKVANKNKDVRVVFKEFPILSAASRKAAEYALAMDDNEKYITFHTKLMNHRGSISNAVLSKILTEMKIDEAQLARVVAKRRKKIDAYLEETSDLARRLGINGTPGFIINDEIYPGALDEERFKDAIASARQNLKK